MKFIVAHRVVAAAGIFAGLLLVGCAPAPLSDQAPVVEEQPVVEEEAVSATNMAEAEADVAEAEADVADAAVDQAAEVAAAAGLPSLGEKLDALAASSKARVSPEMWQTFADGIEEVRSSGIVDSALNVGAPAVDAQLPDATGNQVQLSELWARGPVVIVWYRGGWCPYCNLALQAMQEALPAIKEAGGTLVAITPETPDNSLSTSEKNALEFVVLSDVGNEVARQYGLVFQLPEEVSPLYKQMIDLAKYNGDDSDELPLAATYVIDQSGVIRYAFLDADYTKRAEPAAVVEALQAL